LRRQILRLLHLSEDSSSPARLAEGLDEELSSVSYHVQVLKGFEAVKKVDERPVRGAIEHFYVSCVADDAKILALLDATKESDEEK